MGAREPVRVTPSTKVTVAFPFSQIKVQEASDHLVALAALVGELADLVATAVPGPQAAMLRQRAHELAGKVR